jgi:hypothetical protein
MTAFVEAMANREKKSKEEIEKEFFGSSATSGAALRVDGGVIRAIL